MPLKSRLAQEPAFFMGGRVAHVIDGASSRGCLRRTFVGTAFGRSSAGTGRTYSEPDADRWLRRN
jgi:hypothetical protein